MIIKRVSGQEFMGFLRPVFDELGISREAFCVETPCGHEWGGSGVCFTAREFAKFADLCTHYGRYNGRQLLPENYMREATRKQIDNAIEQSSPDTGAGYGYQFWPMRKGFAMHGMGGQFALCLPEKNLTVITNAYDELMGRCKDDVFTLFWNVLYPALSDSPLPEDEAAQASLARLCETLELPCPEGEKHSETERVIAGRRYKMSSNPLGICGGCGSNSRRTKASGITKTRRGSMRCALGLAGNAPPYSRKRIITGGASARPQTGRIRRIIRRPGRFRIHCFSIAMSPIFIWRTCASRSASTAIPSRFTRASTQNFS